MRRFFVSMRWLSCRTLPAFAAVWLIALGSSVAQAQQPDAAPRKKGFSGVLFGTEKEGGPVIIKGFFEGSPAAEAGIKEGDILLKIGEVEVKVVQDAFVAFRDTKPGDKVSVKVKRGSEELTFAVTVVERPPEESIRRMGQPAPPPQSFDPLVKIQSEDYAVARSRFKTKLTRNGPSPQPFKQGKPPQGVSEVEYVSGDLRLKAWVNRPADQTRKHPAVLFLHGGYAFEYPDDWDVSQPYRDAGFIVLTPMLRGENGQPGSFSWYYDEVNDALAAAEYLRKLPYVDADHVFIAGPSAGGTLALLTAMASKHFRAAASFSASPDQVLFAKHVKRIADMPIDVTNVRELEVRSPLAYAKSLRCPARIYYGSQEPHLFATSQLTAKLAMERGLDVEAVKIEGDHSTSVPPGIKQSIVFFQKK